MKTLLMVALIVISILWLDRPLSTWTHLHTAGLLPLDFAAPYRGAEIQVTLATLLIGPAEIVSLCYMPAVLILGAILYQRRRLPPLGLVTLRAGIATAAALEIKERLKWVFGRNWPESWAGWNLSWIRDGAYSFHLFHGGPGYESFPSGHTTAIVAFVVPFWHAYPSARPLAVLCALSVALGLLAGDYHFLSDILAGGYLGAVVGRICDGLQRSLRFDDPRVPRGG